MGLLCVVAQYKMWWLNVRCQIVAQKSMQWLHAEMAHGRCSVSIGGSSSSAFPELEFLNGIFSRLGFCISGHKLLRLEFLSGFLPSLFLCTRCLSRIDSSFLVSQFFVCIFKTIIDLVFFVIHQ